MVSARKQNKTKTKQNRKTHYARRPEMKTEAVLRVKCRESAKSPGRTPISKATELVKLRPLLQGVKMNPGNIWI